MNRILFYWKKLNSTFWFIPVLILISFICTAFVLLTIDERIEFSREGLWKYIFIGNSDSARTVLSIISGAMIGVAGTVFSVTLVALTLASNQFGPRLIKNFMYVRLNQIVLGTYVALFIYCIIILNTIKDTDDFTYIPSLSILVALLATVMNIVLLIFFIHRISVSIQADHIISEISESMSEDVDRYFPKTGEERTIEEMEQRIRNEKSTYDQRTVIRSDSSGYLQYLDREALFDQMVDSDQLLELYVRPGDFIVVGQKVGRLYSNDGVTDDTFDDVWKQFILGRSRTSEQDLEFSINQMVEIAVRALSPGVNDPFTAIACIDNLTSTMAHMSNVPFPSKLKIDDVDRIRLVLSVIEYEEFLDAAFNQIRHCSSNSPVVLHRLMVALVTLYQLTTDQEHKKALVRHAERVISAAEEFMVDAHDFQELKKIGAIVLSGNGGI